MTSPTARVRAWLPTSPPTFTASDVAKSVGVGIYYARRTLQTLCDSGELVKVGEREQVHRRGYNTWEERVYRRAS